MQTFKLLIFILGTHFSSPSPSNVEVDCLSRVIYQEARGEIREGKLAVGNVVMNRFKTGKYKSVCAVVQEKRQFAWNPHLKIREKNSWIECRQLSVLLLKGIVPDNTHNATYFHERHIKPSWGRRKWAMRQIIGSHAFYST